MTALEMTYLGIPGYAVFWILTIIAFGLFAFRLSRLVRYMFLGQPEKGFAKLLRRGLATATITLGQWCQLKGFSFKDKSGVGHAFLAWGFFVFVTFYLVFIIIGAGFGLSDSLEHSAFFFYYSWIMDIIAPIVMLATLWAIIRRYIIKPPRLKGEQTAEAMIILISVLLHPLTHLFKIASGIALEHPPAGLGSVLPPVSSALSNVFNNLSPDAIEAASAAFFWAHWLVILFVLVYIGYSRYLHMLVSFFNIFFRSPLPAGALRSIDLETAASFGAAKISDLTWKQVLDLYSCVVCGQCQDNCPATISGKTLNPKQLILDLKKDLLQTAPKIISDKENTSLKLLAGEVIAGDDIWACTTCRACDEVCPLYVEHVDKIVDLRRNLVMEQALIPESAEQALRSIEARGHPWRGATASRTDWAEGLDIKIADKDNKYEILLWVGCSGALEERSMRSTRALAQLLKHAGVDFAILGSEESCCGDPARRLGNEYLFQMQAEQNIGRLNDYCVSKIVSACPHCYNTIKNEYPAFGGHFEVIHHSQLIAELIQKGRLALKNNKSNAITYHDPCYLGRYNGIFKQPRNIFKNLPGARLAEMQKKGSNSFCCGGGGGRMWLEENSGRRINEMRIEQVLETKAATLVSACPLCLQMFEDAVKAKDCQSVLRIMDIAELVAEAAGLED